MKDRTTLQVPKPLLKRLKNYGGQHSTYAEILSDLMDNMDRVRYFRQLRSETRDRRKLIPHKRV